MVGAARCAPRKMLVQPKAFSSCCDCSSLVPYFALALEQLLWFVGPLHAAIKGPMRPAAHHQPVGVLTPADIGVDLRVRAERSASASGGWWRRASGGWRLTPVSREHASRAGLIEDGALPLGKMTHTTEAGFPSLGSEREMGVIAPWSSRSTFPTGRSSRGTTCRVPRKRSGIADCCMSLAVGGARRAYREREKDEEKKEKLERKSVEKGQGTVNDFQARSCAFACIFFSITRL